MNVISYKIVMISGSSMVPLLKDSDLILIKKINSFNNLKRKDIIAFLFFLETKKIMIKRLIGLPHDKVELDGNLLIINDVIIPEPYVTYTKPSYCKFELSGDELIVLGDNRVDSFDSRRFGPLKISSIIGKAKFSIKSLKRL
ncbi:MAG: signal peptidase I [Candidatus Thorarchaeota archaeon]